MDDIDLTDGRIFGRGFPHDVFTTLRREAPGYWQAFRPDFAGEHDPGFWVLSRYADVKAANRDAELFCSYDGPQLAIQPAKIPASWPQAARPCGEWGEKTTLCNAGTVAFSK